MSAGNSTQGAEHWLLSILLQEFEQFHFLFWCGQYNDGLVVNNVDHDRMLLSAQSDLCLHCCLLGHHSLSEYIVLLWYVVKILGVPHFIVEMFCFCFWFWSFIHIRNHTFVQYFMATRHSGVQERAKLLKQLLVMLCLAHLSIKCSRWAIVITLCPLTCPSWVVRLHQSFKRHLLLTLKMPRKTTSENVICLCRLLHLLASFSNFFWI